MLNTLHDIFKSSIRYLFNPPKLNSPFKRGLLTGSRVALFAGLNVALFEGVTLMGGLSHWSLTALLSTWGGVTVSGFVLVGATTLAAFSLGAFYQWGKSMYHFYAKWLKRVNKHKVQLDKTEEKNPTSEPNKEVVQKSQAEPSLQLVIWRPQPSAAYHAVQSQPPQSQNKGNLFSQAGYLGKAFAANIFSTHGLIRFARYFPPARGLFEYTNLTSVNDLHRFILAGKKKEAAEIIDLVSQDTLDRMMHQRRAQDNNTILSDTLSIRLELFEKLLAKLTPEQRFTHLTAVVGFGIHEDPVIYELMSEPSKKVRTEFWNVVLKFLPSEWQAKLLTHPDHRGDNLLLYLLEHNRLSSVKDLLKNLTTEQIKHCFKTPCPHGLTPMMKIIRHAGLPIMQEFFKILPHEDWQEIFACRPTGWSMTHGEKLMIIANAGERKELIKQYKRFGKKREIVPYLTETFGLKLPESFERYTEEALEKVLGDIDEYNRSVTCEEKQNFKKQHDGKMPEEILGLETWLPIRTYTKAFHQLQLKYHADKNTVKRSVDPAEAERLSRLLNDAHSYIKKVDERVKYEPKMPMN